MQSEVNPLLAITGLAFLFAALVVIFFFYRDRYEREPSLKIVKMFIWGCFSTIPALIINTAALLLFALLFPIGNDPELIVAQMLLAVMVAPITEETFKGIPVLRMQRDPEMYGMMDGLVYGAVCGAGFAFIENILYGLNILSEIYALYGTIILAPALILTAFRSVMMPAGHSLYTGWFGSEVGKEKTPYGGSPLKGFIIAVILHTIWNGMASALSIVLPEELAILSWVFVLGTLAVYYILLWWRMNTALAIEKPNRSKTH
ncbi:MAG: PrsW family intramembrane metalloprotease [Candidatus Hermodarchaeota archaeon]